MIGNTFRLVMIVLLAAACSQSETLTDTDRIKIVSEATGMLENYYRDIRQEGLKAEFKYLDNSPDFFWVPPGYTRAISYDSVATILRANASLLKSVDNSFDTLSVIPLSKQLATYSGRLRSVVTDTSGLTSTHRLVETGTLIKRKDGWKLLNGQTSIIQ